MSDDATEKADLDNPKMAYGPIAQGRVVLQNGARAVIHVGVVLGYGFPCWRCPRLGSNSLISFSYFSMTTQLVLSLIKFHYKSEFIMIGSNSVNKNGSFIDVNNWCFGRD